MMAETIIRDPRPEDEAAWRALWARYCAFYKADIPESTTASTWGRILDRHTPMFCRLAERDGEVIGFAICTVHESSWRTTPSCYLEDLFVSPAARSTRVGKALIDDLVALCEKSAWSRLYWHTARDNATARRLYDHYGEADAFVRYRLTFNR